MVSFAAALPLHFELWTDWLLTPQYKIGLMIFASSFLFVHQHSSTTTCYISRNVDDCIYYIYDIYIYEWWYEWMKWIHWYTELWVDGRMTRYMVDEQMDERMNEFHHIYIYIYIYDVYDVIYYIHDVIYYIHDVIYYIHDVIYYICDAYIDDVIQYSSHKRRRLSHSANLLTINCFIVIKLLIYLIYKYKKYINIFIGFINYFENNINIIVIFKTKMVAICH